MALAVSGVTMVVLGLLGILSIGLPILAAGASTLAAAARAASPRQGMSRTLVVTPFPGEVRQP
jgi:hypothetical protein